MFTKLGTKIPKPFPDLSGKMRETITTVRMPKKMQNEWMKLCKKRGLHYREAIRDLVEKEIREAHGMPPKDLA